MEILPHQVIGIVSPEIVPHPLATSFQIRQNYFFITTTNRPVPCSVTFGPDLAESANRLSWLHPPLEANQDGGRVRENSACKASSFRLRHPSQGLEQSREVGKLVGSTSPNAARSAWGGSTSSS